MNDKQKIAIIKQQIAVIKAKEKLSKVCLPVIEQWKDKEINKRLATALQNELDKVYGTIPMTDEQKEWNRDGKDYYSKVWVRYEKEFFGNEPRYNLKVWSRDLVEELPDIQHESYNSPDPNNDNEVEIGATYAHDYEDIVKCFSYDYSYITDYKRILDNMKQINEEYEKYTKAMRAWSIYKGTYDTAGYTIKKLWEK